MTHDAEEAAEQLSTGHDVHFLERLERVDLAQTELALRLYRSPALVRALLADPLCPRDTERVAIALQPGPAPPHVVIARDGGFVTCLGAEMAVNGTPILSWDRLSIHLHRDAVQTEQRARAADLLAGDEIRTLLRRIYTAGPALTREEFCQLLVVEPMLRRLFLDEAMSVIMDIYRLAIDVARIKRIHNDEERRLKAFWGLFFAAGHLLLLSSRGGHRSFADWSPLVEEQGVDVFKKLYLSLSALGHAPTLLRVAWALGRAGKLALPSLKQAILDAQNEQEWNIASLGLLAIGLRHQSLRAEIAGAIGPARLPRPLRHRFDVQQWAQALQEMLRGGFLPLDTLSLPNHAALVLTLVMFDPELSPTSTNYKELLEKHVAQSCLRARVANVPLDCYKDPARMPAMSQAVFLLATQPAEEFYFPAAEIAAAPAFSLEAAQALAWFARPAGPVRAKPTVGRNAACPCGSGKKFKKCCGA